VVLAATKIEVDVDKLAGVRQEGRFDNAGNKAEVIKIIIYLIENGLRSGQPGFISRLWR
jgi:hypothetical protein